ncbi:hypothetical protein G7Y89_g4080 [Cudoniella acicularis]|uniref:Uncharacterized protein n=1 Tax=Cudoniella acicularis TaxID=354080 RepID=A0A8H4RQ68_9HELO|nr:hypothetical protein G7Y89_g4080 [Cudoniella acicularis]
MNNENVAELFYLFKSQAEEANLEAPPSNSSQYVVNGMTVPNSSMGFQILCSQNNWKNGQDIVRTIYGCVISEIDDVTSFEEKFTVLKTLVKMANVFSYADASTGIGKACQERIPKIIASSIATIGNMLSDEEIECIIAENTLLETIKHHLDTRQVYAELAKFVGIFNDSSIILDFDSVLARIRGLLNSLQMPVYRIRKMMESRITNDIAGTINRRNPRVSRVNALEALIEAGNIIRINHERDEFAEAFKDGQLEKLVEDSIQIVMEGFSEKEREEIFLARSDLKCALLRLD